VKDAADRLTPLGVMVLALLREGDMHPYEMIRLMRQRHDDRMLAITNGTLYHTVSRLERVGLLDEVRIDRDGNRPERTTYTLTELGYDVMTDWVRRELPRIDHPAEFRIALAEAHNLPRHEVVDLLITRRAALVGDHAAHTAGLAKALERGVPAQFLVEVERQGVLLAAELQWLDGFVERLESPDLPWGPEELPAEHLPTYLAQRKAAQL
jgi:DNA-binding PadR family transcriptional regulator